MDNTQLSHLLHIQEASRQNKLVVFVGAGVSANSGIPTWSKLIESFKSELSDDLKTEKDDLKVAQLYKDSRGFKEYFEKTRIVLKDGKCTYNPIHNAILELSPSHIITTNYDDLIEQSIQANFKQYDIITRDCDLPYSQYPNKVVKMHGDFNAGNIVLAEDDYYNYTMNFPLIRSFVTSLFTTNVVLFVGFSFTDLNLKLILNEINTILGKNMQKAYLLTDKLVNRELMNYYNGKGINVVDICNPDEYVSKYKINIKDAELNKLTSSIGKNLYKQLQIINQIEIDYSEDLLSLLAKKLKETEPELNVIGDGVKYLLPRNAYSFWNHYSGGLQLLSPYFKKLESNLRTIDGKRKFIETHSKDERMFLLQQAFVNQVYTIDNLSIISDKNYEKIRKSFDEIFEVDYFFKFDFNHLFSSIKEIKKRGTYHDKRDIIFPYILCQLGRYYEAYLQYKSMLSELWGKKRYILYFICLYNMYNIRYQIKHEAWHNDEINADTIIDEIEQFDLDSILAKLPIEQAYKQSLQELLSYEFFSRKSLEADELSRQIHRQKKHADRGGASINSNIYNLTSKFWQVFNYCVSNCIEFNNSYFSSLVKDTITGILNSHLTIDNKLDGRLSPTKLNSLSWSHVFIFLFYINSNELEELFKQYEVNEIVLEKETVEEIVSMIHNLYEYLPKKAECQNYKFDIGIVMNILSNIVLLLGYSSTEFPKDTAEKLYIIIHKLWRFPYCNSLQNTLHRLLKKSPPTSQTAINLLQDSISYDRYKSLKIGHQIAIQLFQSDTFYDKIDDVKLLFDQTEGRLGHTLFKILPKNTQKQFVEYYQQHCKSLLYYLSFIYDTGISITDTKYLNNLIEHPNYTYGFEQEQILISCWYLAYFRQQELYSNIHAIIDKYGNRFEPYLFYLDPSKYEKTNLIETKWLMTLEDDEIKQLLIIDEIRDKVKTDILSNKLDKKETNRIIGLL